MLVFKVPHHLLDQQHQQLVVDMEIYIQAAPADLVVQAVVVVVMVLDQLVQELLDKEILVELVVLVPGELAAAVVVLVDLVVLETVHSQTVLTQVSKEVMVVQVFNFLPFLEIQNLV
jgi:hypothetical protein